VNQKLRNVAIVAHVDHGKTSLVDCLFQKAGALDRSQTGTDRLMDRNDLERERGITILSKHASVTWEDTCINLIDTPGHADFGGQVERVLAMADGVLLVVDAFEGVMPQTRFVLTKAFEHGLHPLVVINKMDRQDARAPEVIGEVFDLFVDLGAEDMALDFPVVYASARDGWSSLEENIQEGDMGPLLDSILKHVPAPDVDESGPLQVQVATLDWDNFVGRLGIGRVKRGVLRQGDNLAWLKNDGSKGRGKIKELFRYAGMSRVAADSVVAGDIACISGIEGIGLGDTLCDPNHPEPLAPITVEKPTIEMAFLVNDSPLAGREGEFVTSRQVLERLQRAAMIDPALRVDTGKDGGWVVAGRGVMHIGILIENMRREGFEFAVGKPRVLTQEVDGKTLEPWEAVQVELPEDTLGRVIEFFGKRSAEIREMDRMGSRTVLHMRVPTRGMIGARTHVLTLTRGEGVVHSLTDGYDKVDVDISTRHAGVLVSSDTGTCTAYALRALEDRGEFFIAPGDVIYEGMVCGENNKDTDLVLNVVKGRKHTNVRSANKDVDEKIRAPRDISLEGFLEYLDSDELLEVTPQSLRLRKRYLNEKDRRKHLKGIID
jgi:GTP-binding protein